MAQLPSKPVNDKFELVVEFVRCATIMVQNNKMKKRKQRQNRQRGEELVLSSRRTLRVGGAGNAIGANVNQRFGIPSRFPSPVGDVTPANFKFSIDLANTTTNYSRVVLIFGNGTTTGSTLYMNAFCSGFNVMSTVFSRFLIRRIRVGVTQTTPITSGGYFIANYEATASSSSVPPVSVTDVSNSRHVVEGNPANPRSYTVNPTDYYNDWRATYGDGSTTSTSQMGTSQIIVNNALAVDADCALITVEADVVFCGYRV